MQRFNLWESRRDFTNPPSQRVGKRKNAVRWASPEGAKCRNSADVLDLVVWKGGRMITVSEEPTLDIDFTARAATEAFASKDVRDIHADGPDVQFDRFQLIDSDFA